MEWQTTFDMGEFVIIEATQEEAVIAGIKIEIYEDGEGVELYSVRTGNGKKFYGFNVNQLKSKI